MAELYNPEDVELYSKLIGVTENNDIVDGQLLMEIYSVVDGNSKNNKINILNNIILSSIVAYYYEEIQSPELVIELINKILPFDVVDNVSRETVKPQIWSLLLKLVTKGLIKDAVLVLTNFIKDNDTLEQIDDYKLLLEIMINYPLSNLQDLKLFKNWKNLTSEYHSYILNKADEFDVEFVLLVGILNGNEKDISRITHVLGLNSAHWGRLFLSFFLFYIPTSKLFDEYLVKALEYSGAKNEENSIYQDFLIKDSSRIISYVPIMLDLDDVLGLTFIETLNKLNVITLDAEFITLIYNNWIEKYTETKFNTTVNQISILLKLVIQSSLLLSKKRTFVERLLDSLVLQDKEFLVTLNNNDVEYLVVVLSGLRMPHTCKNLYKELGMALLETESIGKENVDEIDASSLINGLSILTKGLEYHVSNNNNENDVLSIIVEKLDIILESNFKLFITSHEKKTDDLQDAFTNLLSDYSNFNPILKQAFVCLKVVKELEKMYRTLGPRDDHKYITFLIELLKFEPLKDKFKLILVVYYLNPVLIDVKNSNAVGAPTNNSTYFELMKELNLLYARYESDAELQLFIQNLLHQYPLKYQTDLQVSLDLLLELCAVN